MIRHFRLLIPVFSALALFYPTEGVAADSTEPAPPKKVTAAEFEAVGVRMLDKLDEWVKGLEGAVDKAGAEAAKPKLEKLVKEFQAVSAEAAQMAKASPEVQNAFFKNAKHQDRAANIQTRMVTATQRIAMNREVLTVLQPVLAEFKRASTSKADPPPAKPAPATERPR